MTSFGMQISEHTITSLEKRASRLAALVETATQGSQLKKVRDNGAQLVERLGEWVEEIKELRDMGDEDVEELIKSFTTRLALAEEKIKAWPIPASVRAQIMSAPGSKVRPGGRAKKPIADAA
jgi:hypothetical protein